MHQIGVAHVNHENWRTNISASTNGRIFIPKPIPGRAHKINWWCLDTLAESGDFKGSSKVALIESPLPDGGLTSLDQNALRDEDGLHILIVSGHGGNNGTNANGLGRNPIPHYEYPGGIWTVEDLYIFGVADTGVKLIYSSIGFGVWDIGMPEWLQLRRSSPNSSRSGELFQ